MECPVCATRNSASASECKKCHTPFASSVAQETLNEGGVPEDWTVAGSSKISAAAAESDTLDIGTVLAGRYELLKLIGQGGMGAVYRARNSTALSPSNSSARNLPRIQKSFAASSKS